MTALMGMCMGTGVSAFTSRESIHAIRIPITPPEAESMADSTRNWFSMSLRRAPTDLRMPISRVRSVTTASMIFIITTPPTTMKTLPETAILLGEAAEGSALLYAQRAHAVSAGVTPGKHRSGMEPAARLSAVATRVAATRLDLVDRAFDQFAGLENLPQLAAVLCRQIAQDLPLAGGGIGNRHGLPPGFGANQIIASS